MKYDVLTINETKYRTYMQYLPFMNDENTKVSIAPTSEPVT